MNCSICGRPSKSTYCERHETAYRNLVERFKDWNEAMEITWERFLEEVKLNPSTGIWAREVAMDVSKKRV
ncbi:MAG: hypothetical protein QXJ75_03645 [Candidatus Bathyarchaeia archaeon]